MSFLKGRLGQRERGNPYEPLGYAENPFPAQGEVRADVFVPRPELEELGDDLAAFLKGRGRGSVWALLGEQGLGKSNFLHHLDRELSEMSGSLPGTAHRLLPSIALSPARVAEELMAAIGYEQIRRLVEVPRAVPPGFATTDFEHFWQNAFQAEDNVTARAQFLMRWLSGHQTYQAERKRYGIHAREPLPPAVVFPFLRALVQMLEAAGILQRLLLLLDEFEDVQLLRRAERSEYVHTLKALLNAFNWRGMYVIIAGAPAAFETIGTSYPSLAGRWRVAMLKPVETSAAAVMLAEEYKKKAVLPGVEWAEANNYEPDPLRVKEIFVELFNVEHRVTQRALLTALHDEVERLAAAPPPRSPTRPRRWPSPGRRSTGPGRRS